jgi:hypothetical protein
MPIHGHLPKTIPADQLLASARAAMAAVEPPPGCDMDAVHQAPASLVSHWPAWVIRAGALVGNGVYCLWCQPHPDPRETFPSQLILNVPAGRYMVDVLDVSRAAWASRESASGNPLVAGLPYTAGTLLVWIRMVELVAPTERVVAAEPVAAEPIAPN